MALQLIDQPDKWALFNHLPAPTFVHSSAPFALLGDAAHATSPHLGAGAGFVIEDSYILANLIRSPSTPVLTVEDLQRAFVVYDKIRRARGLELVVRSRERGMLLDLMTEDGSEVADWQAQLKKELPPSLKWVWTVDLPGMLAEGRKLLDDLSKE
jgi:salicylate hydroxylase